MATQRAYAKLYGRAFPSDGDPVDFEAFLTQPAVVLGRGEPGKENEATGVDISLGSDERIGEHHCAIFYDIEHDRFEIVVLCGDSIIVNGKKLGAKSPPLPIGSRTCIDIASGACRLCFVLPPSVAGATPSATAAPVAAAGETSTPGKGNGNAQDTDGASGDVLFKDLNNAQRERLRLSLCAFGVGRWKEIADDMASKRSKSFGFSSIPQLRDYASQFVIECTKYAEPGDYRSIADEIEQLRTQYPNGARFDSLLRWEKMQRNARFWMRKLDLAHRLRWAVENVEEEALLEQVQTTMGEKRMPTAWWTAQDDMVLLRGMYKHGLGNFDQVLEHENDKFSSKLVLRGGRDLDPNETSVETLMRRLRQLISLAERKFGRKRRANKADGKRGRAAGGSEGSASRLLGKRDRTRLERVLVQFGAPPLESDGRRDWAAFAERHGFTFSADALAHAFVVVVLRAHEAAGDQVEVPEAFAPHYVETNIPQQRGVRLVEALWVFDMLLSNITTREDLEEDVRDRVSEGSRDLPSWWFPGDRFDLALLRGAAKHGATWENVFTDESLPFFEVRETYSLSDIPEHVLTARLKYLVQALSSETDPVSVLTEEDVAWAIRVAESGHAERSEPAAVTEQPVERDEDGMPKMPLTVTPGLVVENLGSIVSDRPGYHSSRIITPIGYCARRRFNSCVNPGNRSWYTCEIIEHGDKPMFKVTPSDDPEKAITSESMTRAWLRVLDMIDEARGDTTPRKQRSISGPGKFGLSEPLVQRLIEELPGANLCTEYRMRYFSRNGGASRPSSGQNDGDTESATDTDDDEADDAEEGGKQQPSHSGETSEFFDGEHGEDDAHGGTSGGASGHAVEASASSANAGEAALEEGDSDEAYEESDDDGHDEDDEDYDEEDDEDDEDDDMDEASSGDESGEEYERKGKRRRITVKMNMGR